MTCFWSYYLGKDAKSDMYVWFISYEQFMDCLFVRHIIPFLFNAIYCWPNEREWSHTLFLLIIYLLCPPPPPPNKEMLFFFYNSKIKKNKLLGSIGKCKRWWSHKGIRLLQNVWSFKCCHLKIIAYGNFDIFPEMIKRKKKSNSNHS